MAVAEGLLEATRLVQLSELSPAATLVYIVVWTHNASGKKLILGYRITETDEVAQELLISKTELWGEICWAGH